MVPWAHPSPQFEPNNIPIGSVVFAQLTAESALVGRPFSLQNCPFSWGIWTPSNTWFFEPTRVLNPNGILIG